STPGITLFMRLPVSLDADVAFEFLLREAQELCGELDGQLRDADRNTLTPQTIQHMMEDIQQYSFRQKTLAHA
ncbi:MAG: cell division protein ZipA C-terminal FtsZ-binding domain-containing protein, partial [Pseudomonadota bacterium]